VPRWDRAAACCASKCKPVQELLHDTLGAVLLVPAARLLLTVTRPVEQRCKGLHRWMSLLRYKCCMQVLCCLLLLLQCSLLLVAAAAAETCLCLTHRHACPNTCSISRAVVLTLTTAMWLSTTSLFCFTQCVLLIQLPHGGFAGTPNSPVLLQPQPNQPTSRCPAEHAGCTASRAAPRQRHLSQPQHAGSSGVSHTAAAVPNGGKPSQSCHVQPRWQTQPDLSCAAVLVRLNQFKERRWG
jgi:hypothetical protein